MELEFINWNQHILKENRINECCDEMLKMHEICHNKLAYWKIMKHIKISYFQFYTKYGTLKSEGE